MPAERFFIDASLEGHLILEGPEHHHLAHVMRVRVGETVELVNGKGALASAKLIAVTKKGSELEVLSAKVEPLPAPALVLAIAFLRPAKLELIVEKCTELGAGAFYFYPAAHSEKTDLSEHQQERLRYVAVSAMKQCGRLDLPEIKIVGKLEKIFDFEGPHFFGDPGAKESWKPSSRAIFITGPEKGFSEKEMTLLNQKAKGVLLHKNVLRAETAPIAAACAFSQF